MAHAFCRLRVLLWATLALLSVMLCAAFLVFVIPRPCNNRVRTLVYDDPRAAHLTEELAISYAERAIAATCESPQKWIPVLDDRARTPDRYLVRNTINADSGNLFFRDAQQKSVRYVCVTVDGKRVQVAVTPGE